MCGIAGTFAFQGGGNVDPVTLCPMIEALAHRGPDGLGAWVNAARTVVLFHARLAITDRLGGAQPICDPSGTIWVVCNGEFYGAAGLRHALEAEGCVFKSRSDTELLPFLYLKYGEAFLSRLRGEFAFALYDSRKNVLYLVRDRFGVKPLFYAMPGTSIAFGSEIKSLLRHPEVKAQFDRRKLGALIGGAIPPDGSVFEDIMQVRPGSFLRIGNGMVREVTYWQPNWAPMAVGTKDRTADLVDEFRALFDESVELRLQGDVEIGTYLSGGLDSSAVTSSMARFRGNTVKTFSVGFGEAKFDEAPAFRQVAGELGLRNYEINVDAQSLGENLVGSIWHGEMPVLNLHSTAKYLLSKLASQHVKAVLTGEGADELLAGYACFRHVAMLEATHDKRPSMPRFCRMIALIRREGMLSGIVPALSLWRHGEVVDLFGAYPYLALRILMFQKTLSRFLSAEFRGSSSGRDVLDPLSNYIGRGSLNGLSSVLASQKAAVMIDLPGYILSSLGDRQEMAHAIEGRTPFLDHRLAEFAMRLPLELKLNGVAGKLILRHAMKDRLSPATKGARKRVFLAPTTYVSTLVRMPALARYLSDDRIKSVGMFEPRAIKLAMRMAAVLPRHSPVRALLETVLMMAMSVHILDDLFVSQDAATRPCPSGRFPAPWTDGLAAALTGQTERDLLWQSSISPQSGAHCPRLFETTFPKTTSFDERLPWG